MTRRFLVAAVVGAPVFLLTMVDMIRGGMTQGSATNWLGLVLSTPVVLWAGWPFFERAWLSLVNRSPNMFTLIGLGVGSAYAVQRGRHRRARSLSGRSADARNGRDRTSTRRS